MQLITLPFQMIGISKRIFRCDEYNKRTEKEIRAAFKRLEELEDDLIRVRKFKKATSEWGLKG